jgi:pilus assembly protein CpaE
LNGFKTRVMTDFLLVHPDSGSAQAVKNCLASFPEYRLVATVLSGREASYYLQSNPIRVLLISVHIGDVDPFQLIAQFKESYPDLCIVPILEGTEAGDVWQRLFPLNLGIVINGVADFNSMTQAIRTAASTAEMLAEKYKDVGSLRGSSYMVAVAGARGGVGKTTFAVNLAVAMAKLSAKTTLIDFSMNAGDFLTMLDMVPRNTLAEVVGQSGSLDITLLRNLVADHPLGFQFLACPNQDFDYFSIDYETGKNILGMTRGISEFQVVDTGTHDLPSTHAALDEANVVFLLTTRDLARLMAMQRLIKLCLSRDNPPEKLKVIVNNAEIGTEISEQEIEGVLEHPVTAYLPSNPDQITFSINSGKPLGQSKPDLPYIGVIEKLAEYSAARWIE